MQVAKAVRIAFLALVMNSLVAIERLSASAAAVGQDSGSTSNYGLGFFLFLLLISTMLLVRRGRRRQRKHFSTEVKRGVLKKQKHKCAYCKYSPGVLDFDHRDGNRSNNRKSNCVALCPNCHAKKTRGLIVINNKSGSPVKLIIVLFIFLLLAALILSSRT